MTARYDIAIVGSGFAGSLLAMIARRLGRSVVLIERGRHPRVRHRRVLDTDHQSSSGRADRLATICRRAPLAKWGNWQRTHPEIACGLKRGFTFYHHDLDKPRHSEPPDRSEQLLVAASPHDEISDTHWYRADFDHFLVREAQRLGVDYLDETDLTGFAESNDEVRAGAARGTAAI